MKLNDLDLNKLQTFLVLTQTGSMARAAKELLRTPSAISQSLSRLEASLGVPLFHRVGVRLHLTEEGKELASGLARYQSELGGLLEQITSRRGGLAGSVRLGLPPGFSPTQLGPVFAELLKDAPDVQLRLKFLSQSELAEALVEAQLDFAFSLQPLSQLNRNLRSHRIYEEELILVSAAPAARRRAGERKHFEVIEYYQAPATFTHWVEHYWEGRAIPRNVQQARVRAYASTLEYVLDLVRRGVGVAVVPRQAVKKELSRGVLREVQGGGGELPQSSSESGPQAPAQISPWMSTVWFNETNSATRSPACGHFRGLLQNQFRIKLQNA